MKCFTNIIGQFQLIFSMLLLPIFNGYSQETEIVIATSPQICLPSSMRFNLQKSILLFISIALSHILLGQDAMYSREFTFDRLHFWKDSSEFVTTKSVDSSFVSIDRLVSELSIEVEVENDTTAVQITFMVNDELHQFYVDISGDNCIFSHRVIGKEGWLMYTPNRFVSMWEMNGGIYLVDFFDIITPDRVAPLQILFKP